MISIIFSVLDPTLNLIKIHPDDRCVVLQIKSQEDIVGLHFDTPEDLDAFIGLLQIAKGQTPP
jgi:hypothetical protein